MNEDADSPGLLTPKQRQYLRGETDEELSQAAQRMRRSRIRDRVRNGIADFTLLAEHLNKKDREQTFENYGGGGDAFGDGVINTFRFLFLGLADTGAESPPKTGYLNPGFDVALRRGVVDACKDLGMTLNKWEFEYQTINNAHIERRLNYIRENEEGPIYPSDIEVLLQIDIIDEERLYDFVRDELRTGADE